MSNIIKCRRCRKTFIIEEYDNHVCTPILTDVKEIMIDYYFKARSNNNDIVIMVKGLDGTLYRMVECRHNFTHKSYYPSDESLQGDKSYEDLTEP